MPVLVKERILDDRGTKFGKTIIERDFQMLNGETYPILCVSISGIVPVVIFPLTDRGTVLLLNQFRFGINAFTYELPGGCSKKMHWQEAAKEELLEETGAVASSIELIGGPIELDPALGDARVLAVLAKGCTIVKSQHLDATEEAEVVEITVAEFREMARSGKITDAKTVAIGYLALDHLGLLG